MLKDFIGQKNIIEDVENTYWPPSKDWPGMEFNKESLVVENNREDFDKFVMEELIRGVDENKNDIFSVHFYNSAIIITKKLG